MDLNSFCPRCGQEVDRLYGDERKLCGSCYAEKNDLVDLPDSLDIEVCKKCGRTKCDGVWRLKTSKESKINYSLSKYFKDIDAGYDLLSVSLEDKIILQIRKHGLKQQRTVETNKEEVICCECKGFQGEYAKTKLQIRGENLLELTGLIEKRCSTLEEENHDDFLLDKRSTDGGIDFFLSTEHMSQQVMDTVCKEFNVDVDRSYKQIGHRGGQPVIQNTVLVRHSKD
ncbi:MAG: NMD protein affecting ribosome stability and mRNA decay [Candidatus Nanosalina sp. J07AB43]|nr:MAG: NMD protein affecting ribosome stability and mRNA decay [Candidatus Nanosalina sp. J07AB43]